MSDPTEMFPPGVQIIVCTRTSARCDICSFKAPHVCQYKLRGRLAGTVCGKKLCQKHASVSAIDEATLLCPGHKTMEEKELGTKKFDPATRKDIITPGTAQAEAVEPRPRKKKRK